MPPARSANKVASTATDTASAAQGRFTVQLPAELGYQLDDLAEHMRKAVEEQLGYAPELSRAAVVQALVKGALAQRERHQASLTSGATGTADADVETVGTADAPQDS